MTDSNFGVIGLGVMGRNLSLNIAEKGYPLSVYNRAVVGEENIVSDFLLSAQELKNAKIEGFTDLKQFINSLNRPRKIILMIPAIAIDNIITLLKPLLTEGDIIIDGGNSYFGDTQNRYKKLINNKLHFFGVGISGGKFGARNGPAIMFGGDKNVYEKIAPLFLSIAAKDCEGKSCCSYIGTDGAGHFVKMIHNGIEYAEMQLLAEIYSILSINKSNEEINALLLKWNKSNLASYLLEITANILTKKEGDGYLLDIIVDKAENKGTGSWSAKVAFDVGTVNTMMSSAVFARYISSLKAMRTKLSKNIDKVNVSSAIEVETLKKAYFFARIINHQQGFELMSKASNHYNWNISLAEVARVWTNGCIIKSDLMMKCADYLKVSDQLFDNQDIIENLKINEEATQKILSFGLANRLWLPLFSEAHSYWVAMTTKRLSANLIQAQRDYFGSHSYQKIGYPENKYFNTNWH